MRRPPLASLPLPLLFVTFGFAGVSPCCGAAIVTINDTEPTIQYASLDQRARSSSSSSMSSHIKGPLAPAASTTTTDLSPSPTTLSDTPTYTPTELSTTSRSATLIAGPHVSSPTMVPNAIIGVGVAGFVLLLVVGGGWWWWWWWRRRKRGGNRATILSLDSRGVAESGSGDSALSARESCTLMLRRDTLVSESATSDTTLHVPYESFVEVRTSGVVRFETPLIRESIDTGDHSDQPPTREPTHDALEHITARLRSHAMLPPALPIQSPIIRRGPPSPIFTPPRTPPRSRGPYGEYDAGLPMTPLSPRPVRRRLVTVDGAMRVGGGPLGRAVSPLQLQTRPRSDTSSSLPPHCRLHPP
ncbi:hypothetical protein LXA43DRAFT_138832 [Ganoderma leucocontextum]|nr:hypothetical protein LXA43DRAFT_138832 [Ganoderma leucocontextum]